MSLPVLYTGDGELAVMDQTTGELASLRDSSDHALAAAARVLADYDAEVLSFKRALAAEMRQRHGVGTVQAGGYSLTVAESQSWPVARTIDVLKGLVDAGVIDVGDYLRCVPEKPKPDGRQLKALILRLTLSDPDAARLLADAATLSPPSLRDIRRAAIEEAA